MATCLLCIKFCSVRAWLCSEWGAGAQVRTGRSINDFSFFPAEGEILLTPSHRFFVSGEPYVLDGYTMLDMVEQKGEIFVT